MDSAIGQKSLKIIALGETGVGKSTLLNLLAGADKFIVGHSGESQTVRFEEFQNKWAGDSSEPLVSFIDCQGFGDNQGNCFSFQEFYEYLKSGINLVLFLIPCTDSRLSKVKIDSLKFLFSFFGDDDFHPHFQIVINQIERLKEDKRDEKSKLY